MALTDRLYLYSKWQQYCIDLISHSISTQSLIRSDQQHNINVTHEATIRESVNVGGQSAAVCIAGGAGSF